MEYEVPLVLGCAPVGLAVIATLKLKDIHLLGCRDRRLANLQLPAAIKRLPDVCKSSDLHPHRLRLRLCHRS
jgi:hypothetical protein